MKISFHRSLAGVLAPVFTLRTENDLGIGDTAGVRQMIDWCHRHHLNVFQTLPINETGADPSPYNALSAFAIEPTTLALTPEHVPDLSVESFRRIAAPKRLAQLRRGEVNYPKVKTLKSALLEAAFERFLRLHFNRTTPRAVAFRAFLMDNVHWLPDYALFRVLMEQNRNQCAWERWPAAHQEPARARAWLLSLPEKHREALLRRQLFFMYVQWLAFSQWAALKPYGETRRVYLMGDMPFGVARCSADVWANRAIFDLDWSGGAPPEKVFAADPFTAKWGQNWGIPNYRWAELRSRNYDWWRARVGHLRKVFHLYRIDHVLGFFRIYSFPWPPGRNEEFLSLPEAQVAARTGGRLPEFKPFADDTPEHRAANQAQGEEILQVIKEASGDTLVVAEDLGVVPDYVPPTLSKLGIPGFRIPFLCREPDGRYTDPRQYPRLSVASPSTHDHPPLAAAWADYWRQIDHNTEAAKARQELGFLMASAGLQGPPPRQFSDQLHEAFTRALMAANSWLVVFPITEILNLPIRFNVPGSSAASNWSSRLPCTIKQLDQDPRLRAKTEMFSRLAREAGRGVC